ncbi:histone-like nucleoid-structuring protein Lsr2 [Actinacidiphila glaucinigra]|uniref:histone-like nucleoid-structuring protein Lsr2 n=1 Tax=Actinacidiphila glaucinigra TaxID=235986 RepID=UPI003D8ADB03
MFYMLVQDLYGKSNRRCTIAFMAQKLLTIFTDDITGESSDDVATHSFVLDGVTYEIDLSVDSYDVLLEKLGPYLGAARRTGRHVKRSTATRLTSEEASTIRAWAKTNGYEVNDRGRVPGYVRQAFERAT